MPINKNELTKEQIQKAMACETAEELMALAKVKRLWPARPPRSLWRWRKRKVLN